MKNILITVLIILSSNVHAQELNEANKILIAAKQLSNDGYIDSAITTYELAFKQIEYVHSKHIYQIIELAKQRKDRSEEHTSELQSRPHLVCRLLLEKKKQT